MIRLAVPERNVVRIKTVSDEEVPDVDMAGPLASGSTPVAFKPHRTLVVLFKVAMAKRESLGLQKVLDPDGTGKKLTGANQFRFR